MNVCDGGGNNGGHTQICYENRDCPMCMLIAAHKEELESKDEDVRQLTKEVKDLEDSIDETPNCAQCHMGEEKAPHAVVHKKDVPPLKLSPDDDGDIPF
jgi:hypothetical protein